jgi:phage terminase large subunit GpA-like protein
MKCGVESRLTWAQLQYGDPNGEALKCEACGVCQPDFPQVRRHICEAGHWQAQNPSPQAGVVSYHWNALLPPWVKWADLVSEWHRANELKKQGNIEPLRVFVCETLGEPWEERVDATDFAHVSQRKGDFVIGAEWPLEKRRFMPVDVQADHFYWCCRAFGLGGVSRLIDYGRIFGWEDVRAIQQRLKVRDGDVVVDSGFRTGEVYQQCLKFGWKPSKGVAQDYFVHVEPDGTHLRRSWQISQTDPQMGTSQQGVSILPLVLFCADATKDTLALFMHGTGPSWELPNDIGEEYLRHLVSERPELDKKGRRVWVQKSKYNHWLDCEVMNITAALILGLVASEAKVNK